MKTYPLGRLPAADIRDHDHLIRSMLPPVTRTSKYYWSGWHGDQGSTSSCVGFSWTHWLVAGPTTQTTRPWDKWAYRTYDMARTLDEWEGENYDGTSVRAGAKALQQAGFISEYKWAWTADEVVRAVLEIGPVVVGTSWLSGMFTPTRGKLNVTGSNAGGHAYLIDGANRTKGLVRIKNSWGVSWGTNGRAYMTVADLERLLADQGEACLAIETRGEPDVN